MVKAPAGMSANSPRVCTVMGGVTALAPLLSVMTADGLRGRSALEGEQQLLMGVGLCIVLFLCPIAAVPPFRSTWCDFINRLEVDDSDVFLFGVLLPLLLQLSSDVWVLGDEVVGLARIISEVVQGVLTGATHRFKIGRAHV